ncbi:MAG: hypothetical protein Q8P02_02565 [Candidatus Micrarchaeota archaeon]|nr:hypothetical protein [Candidatus Micrarchaeota archaeon]
MSQQGCWEKEKMHASQPQADSDALTKNLQALSHEEEKAAHQAEATEIQKAKLVEAAKTKAQTILEKAREKAEEEREAILAAEQEKVDQEVKKILANAEKQAAAIRKKDKDISEKLLPIVFS